MGEKTTAERGQFKMEIHNALYKSSDIRELILGDANKLDSKETKTEFKKYVKSHLFIDDTITETKSYIFYDIRFPSLKPQIKKCQIVMYAICHRDILDTYSKEGYYGDRADVLAQMIESVLVNNEKTSNRFGIGELSLDSIDIYNATRFYGSILTFSVPAFR